MKAAVIFDVDGPLLDLTAAESAAFFVPFAEAYGLSSLSEDWDSYRIRNDLEIFREVLENAGYSADEEAITRLVDRYLAELKTIYGSGEDVAPIPGALRLLEQLSRLDGLALGTATANFEAAAEFRLQRAGMWPFVKRWHSGAEGGGPKRDVLARVINRLGLPGERIVFIGDNLNDLDAARANGTHFIGFHIDADRRARLADAGAATVTGDHDQSLRLIQEFLDL